MQACLNVLSAWELCTVVFTHGLAFAGTPSTAVVAGSSALAAARLVSLNLPAGTLLLSLSAKASIRKEDFQIRLGSTQNRGSRSFVPCLFAYQLSFVS